MVHVPNVNILISFLFDVVFQQTWTATVVALTSDGWKYFVEPAYLFMVICIWAATSMFDQRVCCGAEVFW
jgi:hypothetical protein